MPHMNEIYGGVV